MIRSWPIMRSSLAVLALLLIAGTGAGWYYFTRSAPAVTGAADVTTSEAAPVAAAKVPVNPVPPPDPADPPLPVLDDSDPLVHTGLGELLGADAAQRLLHKDNLIRRAVATVDSLPRRKLSVEQRPWVAAPGSFLITGDDENAVISESNYRRYDEAFAALERVDTTRLAAFYVRIYPLLQRAYQDLGYPDGHFNDRLIKVIDHVLATPRPREPIAIRRPNVFHEFADPGLESLSAGQKLLLRIGPAHRQLLETRLRALRAELARVQ